MAPKKTAQEYLDQCLAAIAELEQPDRDIAQALHRIIAEVAPQLQPRTFYSMPAYYLDGNNVLFFQSGLKFKTRYCTLGFSQAADLDDGQIWPTSYAIAQWNPSVEAVVRQLVAKAAGN